MSNKIANSEIDLFGCPQCDDGQLERLDSGLVCRRCQWSATIEGRIVQVAPHNRRAEFDDLHEVMDENNQTGGVWDLMYRNQVAAAEAAMRPGMVVLDIGCGPRLPYTKPEGVCLIGVEPSIESLRVNHALDIGICGSAAALPLRARSVDLIVCFYSIHHMTGDTAGETIENVNRAFRQFARVLKPGGQLLVFEVCPWSPFFALQRLLWPLARGLLGKHFNFYFWRVPYLERMARRHFNASHPEVTAYASNPFITFPPVFAWQWLKFPRFLYPFTITRLAWNA